MDESVIWPDTQQAVEVIVDRRPDQRLAIAIPLLAQKAVDQMRVIQVLVDDQIGGIEDAVRSKLYA